MLKVKKSGITKTLATALAVALLLATPGLSHHSIAEGEEESGETLITLAPANLEMVKGQISKIEVTEGAVEGGTPWSVVGDNLQLLTTGGDCAYVQATGTEGGTVTYTNGDKTGTCTVTVEDEDCCEDCVKAKSGPFQGACVGDDENGHAGELHVCAHNFPDERLMKYVIENFDSGGYLSESEINAITEINSESWVIHSLEGIKYFTKLERLECYSNQLKTLDVSNCTALEVMNCSKTLLTTLDVSKCPALMELSCDYNQLTTLDVSGCDKLERLQCTYNQLKTLDVSGCAALEGVNCKNNDLETLDVSDCTALLRMNCSNNQLTTLDVRGCNKLETLWCNGNQLKTLDVGKCAALTNLYCSNNQLTTLDVRSCVKIGTLEHDDKIEKLVVGKREEDKPIVGGMLKITGEKEMVYLAVKSSDEKVAKVTLLDDGTETTTLAYGTTELSFVAVEALITAGDLIDKLDSGESITDEDIAAIKAKDPDAVKTVTLVVSAAGEDWGEKTDNSGAENWVDETGKTSAEITGNETVWLKEESGGTGAWYALDNSEGVFEAGSRFWVRWLNKAENPAEWENYYAQLDDAHKTAVEDDNLWIFLVGVTKPDGTEYKDLGTSVPLYIQLGDDWDKEDIAAVFIGGGQDETLTVTYLDDVEYPAGTDTFAKLMLTHFSPYAVYDKLTDAEKAAAAQTGDSTNASAKTGDSTHELSMMFAVLGLGALMIIARKKKIEI